MLLLFSILALTVFPSSLWAQASHYTCQGFIDQIKQEERTEELAKFHEIFGPAADIHLYAINIKSGTYRSYTAKRKFQLATSYFVDSDLINRTATAYSYDVVHLTEKWGREFVRNLVHHGCLGMISIDHEEGGWTTVDNSKATWDSFVTPNWANAGHWTMGMIISDEPLARVEHASQMLVSWNALDSFPKWYDIRENKVCRLCQQSL